MGDIYLTTNSTNPSSIFLGTTWQKIEGRFLLGTSGSGASKATGGSNSKTITQANLPNIKLTVNSFSLSRGTMEIVGTHQYVKEWDAVNKPTGAFQSLGNNFQGPGSGASNMCKLDFQASRAWTGTTNTAQPQTVNLGSGQALDITPSYYTCHMWLRTS